MSKIKNSKLKDIIARKVDFEAFKQKEIDLKSRHNCVMNKSDQELIFYIGHLGKNHTKHLAEIKDIDRLLQTQKIVGLEKEKIQKLLDEKTKERLVADQKNALRMKVYNLYAQNLGFKMEPIRGELPSKEGQLQFTFNHINKADLQEPHSLILRTDGKTYYVSSCQPSIGELNELLSELNKTNDLSSFTIQVRRKFCNLSASM